MTVARQSIYAFQDVRSSNLYRLFPNKVGTSASSGWSRAMVGWYQSAWVKTLEARLNELTGLPRGWNGYRSVPVSFSCAGFAANLLERICTEGLPPPAIVPGSDGTLQIEWHRNGYDVEIDVLGPNNVIATRCHIDSDVEETISLGNDFTPLVDWMNDLIPVEGSIAQAAG